MMSSIFVDESATRVESYTVVTSLRTFLEQLNSLFDHLDNRHTMHSFQSIAIDCWYGN
jgi:hypothetical protein